MTLTHWKPLRDLMPLHNRIHRLLEDDFFKDFGFGKSFEHFSDNWSPATDILETKDHYVFKLDVPGFSKDEISVEFKDNTLSIKGERKDDKEVKDENYHRIERFSGQFSRSFTLPGDTNSNEINAQLKNGTLELRIPKAEEKIAKSISINLN